ncbi:hypothetical protein GSI_06721 [Ganoderma sinense ZZ0214-1]|uniref:Uncharacterized protein n=1 Tax=Ganoderma sinense ZZ0214-1 TaxID=1077348 RepID=A0A2G8SE83_9APHY|nr:hypothetical protein GSI_06721 [Ganoderma sinense ZZ0214-1]
MPSLRQSLIPNVPGAWPSSSRDQHDDAAQDADVSSVSSYGSSAISRARKDAGRKARRRWTYNGPVRPGNATIAPPGLTCSNLASLSPTLSNDLKLSPVTDATSASTATSSPLNTPDLADWPTLLDTNCGSTTFLSPLTSSIPPSDPLARFTPSGSNVSTLCHYPPRLLHSASKDRHFPSPHLDPPLLNFIPSLPPLRLPVHGSSTGYLFPDSPPAPPSPPSEACSTPPSFIIPPPAWGYSPPLPQTPCIATNFFPVTEHLQPSPQSTAAPTSTDSQTPEADSPVLPPGCVPTTEGFDHAVSALTPPEMDVFALDTAVALSTSPSSFSTPLSVQPNSPAVVVATNAIGTDTDLDAYRRPSETTEASVGHHGHDERIVIDPTDASEHTERVLVRRLSAPQPIVWQSPRPPTARTISSRVDVGEDNGPGKRKMIKQPVMGKVRKLGERLRGFFKSKADTPPKARPTSSRATPEYSLMRTTTAITNIEYESEHPIPSPSPRAKDLRSHRRSLPLPSLLPSSVDRVQSTIFKRNTSECDSVQHSPASPSPQPHALSDTHPEDSSSRGNVSPRSPRTPKGRRERTQTAPQTVESEPKSAGANVNKVRRFSLSSALTKSKMDSLRSTVMPRPPLPANLSGQASVLELGQLPATRHTPKPAGQERFWGGELPSPQGNGCNTVTASPRSASPTRSRTRTAPPQASSSPQLPSMETPTAKDKRSRRFSLSSIMGKRSPRYLGAAGQGQVSERSSPTSLKKPRRLSRRRPRGDTVTTITHANVHFDMVSPRPELDWGNHLPALDTSLPNRSSQVLSLISSNGESTYYDAQEQLSEDEHSLPYLDRPCSPRPESDLDSMSFARTPDYSSGTFSFGSSTERDFPLHGSELSSSNSYTPYHGCRRSGARYTRGTSAVSHLVGESTSTPITKTLRFSPSLSLSFDMSCSDADYGDDDEMGRLEREEELSFMRALGFEFDEIARRVREEPL